MLRNSHIPDHQVSLIMTVFICKLGLKVAHAEGTGLIQCFEHTATLQGRLRLPLAFRQYQPHAIAFFLRRCLREEYLLD